MRGIIAIVTLGLVVLTGSAYATSPASVDVNDMVGTPGGGIRVDCPGDVIYDTGMFDDFTPPAGVATAGSAGCFINALNEGGFPADGRRLADDYPSYDTRPITGIKIWARYNAAGWDYRTAVGGLHGYCVKFYEEADFECPNGTVPGELAIGALLFEQHATNFVEEPTPTGLVRQTTVCITLNPPFMPEAERIYWVSVSADFDFVAYAGGVTQWFWRLYTGNYDPICASSWWNTWSEPHQNWHETSVAINQPGWTGWNQSLVLYSGDVPPQTGACCFADGTCQVMTEDECVAGGGVFQGVGTGCDPNPCDVVPAVETTWGQIKANFR